MVHWATKNPVQASTALIFLAFVVKVLLETRGNREVALGVLQSAGAASVLIGLVAAYLPYLLFTGAVYLAIVSLATGQVLTGILAIATVVIAVMLAPAWIVVTLVVAIAALLLFRRVQGRRTRASGATVLLRADWRKFLLASQLIAVTLYLVAPGMWLPPERVTLATGTTEIAYVIEVGNDWTTLLRDSDRLLLRLPTEAVAAREVCRLRPWPSPTIPQLLLGGQASPISDC